MTRIVRPLFIRIVVAQGAHAMRMVLLRLLVVLVVVQLSLQLPLILRYDIHLTL